MRHADSAIILPVERRDSISEMRTHGEKFEYLRREQVVNTVARMVVELDLPCIPAHTIQLSEPRSDNWFE